MTWDSPCFLKNLKWWIQLPTKCAAIKSRKVILSEMFCCKIKASPNFVLLQNQRAPLLTSFLYLSSRRRRNCTATLRDISSTAITVNDINKSSNSKKKKTTKTKKKKKKNNKKQKKKKKKRKKTKKKKKKKKKTKKTRKKKTRN